MAKVKYKYNSESLQMEKIAIKPSDYLKKALVYMIVFGFVGFLSVLLFASFFHTPKEKELKHEIEFQKQQLALLNYELDTLNLIALDLQKKDDEIYRSIFGAKQYPSHLRVGGIGGADRYRDMHGFKSSDDLIETKKRIARLQRKLITQSKSIEEVFALAKNKDKMLASLPAIQPVSNEDLTRVAGGYGMRDDPFYHVPKMHSGMDFTAPTGTEVYATGDGVVERVQTKIWGYGQNIIINHGFGYKTLYAHLSKFKVHVGQQVKRGEVIGYVGSTGKSTGAHLHYEVHKNGDKVNPANFYYNDLTPEQYEEMLKRSQTVGQSLD